MSASRSLLAAALICAFSLALIPLQLRAAEPELPNVVAVEAGPVIDGTLDDPAWQKATVLTLDGFCDQARRDKGEKPADATEARIVTDADHLYVAFRCAESHADGPWVYRDEKLQRRQNSHVMGGDNVAVAIDMGRFGFYTYYMFFVNPAGELYKCYTWPHRYDLVLRDLELPEATSAAKIDRAAKAWTVELKVPLKGMLRYPADGFPSIIGLDLRRVQWGADRGQRDLEIYWTGMADVTGNRVQPHYDHMATWRPLFATFPDYQSAYAAGRGWVQLVFPDSFGHVRLAAGTIDNKLVVGHGERLVGLIGTRAGWQTTPQGEAKIARMFDAPRMEYWDDLRPTDRPRTVPQVIATPPVNKPGGDAPRLLAGPTVQRAGKATRISFELSAATDVAVAIVDAGGRIVRHLAAGVLGPNPPAPLQKDRLAQTIEWDHADDFGRPVPPGRYRAVVSAGLKPAFQLAIPIDKDNWWYQDPTPTAKGLDIERLPDPQLGKTIGHFSWGSINYMAVDRGNEELYIQTRHVYDGRTGNKVRELQLSGPVLSTLSKVPNSGEVFPAGADGPLPPELAASRQGGLLYMTGPNELWRFSRDGKRIEFSALDRHFVPELWGAHSNPHRGVCVGPDGDVYKMHHYMPHTAFDNQVTRIGPDGRIKSYGFIEVRTLAAGVRVDREGNVYIGCTIQPPGALPPKELAEKMPERSRSLYTRVYGSIVKFGPRGGVVRPARDGESAPAPLVTPGRKGPVPFVAEGAAWVHPGLAPMLSRISDDAGGPGCSCRNGRFDLDEFARLFIPDAVSGRIEVTDSNANTIAFIGGRGRDGKAVTPDGVELGWPTVVTVSDEAVYIADYLRFRVVRARLDYAASGHAEIDVGERP